MPVASVAIGVKPTLPRRRVELTFRLVRITCTFHCSRTATLSHSICAYEQITQSLVNSNHARTRNAKPTIPRKPGPGTLRRFPWRPQGPRLSSNKRDPPFKLAIGRPAASETLQARIRAKQVGADQVGAKSSYRRFPYWPSVWHCVSPCHSDCFSLAALLGRVLHGVERLRCPPDALRALWCFPAASGSRRRRACVTLLRSASRTREDSRNVCETKRVSNPVLSGIGARRASSW